MEFRELKIFMNFVCCKNRCIFLWKTFYFQRYPYNRRVDCGCWSKGAKNQDKEFDICHFLRGCSHLRPYHGDCTVGNARGIQMVRRPWTVGREESELASWISNVRSWPGCRPGQSILWHRRRYRRIWCCTIRRGQFRSVRQNPHCRDFRFGYRPLRINRRHLYGEITILEKLLLKIKRGPIYQHIYKHYYRIVVLCSRLPRSKWETRCKASGNL